MTMRRKGRVNVRHRVTCSDDLASSAEYALQFAAPVCSLVPTARGRRNNSINDSASLEEPFMAGFRMHVTTSTVLGCGYAGVGHVVYGLPPDTAIVGGALCGFSGMLPDLDSDYGVPLRETMAFTAAIVPMLLVGRFQSLALSYDALVLAAGAMYLFVRFGITNMIRKYTVHRGMWHSIPTCLIFACLAFLICGANDFYVRCFKAGGVIAGFMSHLLLDEIYAVEWKGGRWRFKKSFGTALKFWGDDSWANFSTYAKLIIVAAIVVGEPSVMQRLEARNPEFAQTYQEWRTRLNSAGSMSTAAAENALETARANAGQLFGSGSAPRQPVEQPPDGFPQQTNPFQFPPAQPPTIRDGFDTARRPGSPFD
jgi:membrane-bound metal-dependent hydrolase YbcI (DUF457 family)